MKKHAFDHKETGALLFQMYQAALKLQAGTIWRSGISARTRAEMKKCIGRIVDDMLFLRAVMEDSLIHERGAAALEQRIYFGREMNRPPTATRH